MFCPKIILENKTTDPLTFFDLIPFLHAFYKLMRVLEFWIKKKNKEKGNVGTPTKFELRNDLSTHQ